MKKTFSLKEVQDISSEMLRTIDRICQNNNLTYYLVCGSVLGAVRHNGPIPWDYDVDITVPLPQLEHFCEVMSKELIETKYRIVMPGDKTIKNNITTFPRITLKNANPRKIHIDVFPQIGITSNPEEQRKFTDLLTEVKTCYRDKKVAYTTNGSVLKRIGKLLMRIKLINVNAEEKLIEFQELCKKYPYETSEYVTNPCGKYGIKNIVPKSYFGIPKRIPYLDMMLPVPEKTEDYLKHYYKDYMSYPSQKEINKMMKYKVTVED